VSAARDEAVVLRTWDYSETSQTVSLFARGAGVIRGLAKGARRPKSAFGGGFEPLTAGEIMFISKPTTELAVLTEWDLREIFHHLRLDLRAHLAGLYFADITHHALVVEDPHPRLFDALVRALAELADGSRVARIVAVYQHALVSETGIAPPLNAEGLPDAEVYGFDVTGGGLTADPGPGGGESARVVRIRRGTLGALRAVASGDAEAADAHAAFFEPAARLLSVYIRAVLSKELATRESLFAALGDRAR
jgi:DNA repair protein RecO (recombination protein O)